VEPANAFFKYLLGFLVFISLSLALTYAVNTYTIAKEAEQQTAAAFQALIDAK